VSGDVRCQPAYLPVTVSSSTIEAVRDSAEGTIEVRLPERTILCIAGGVDAARLGLVLQRGTRATVFGLGLPVESFLCTSRVDKT
jgi:hypothetical protein